MDDYEFIKAMELISAALKESGYSVREQLEGYLLGGNAAYITRRKNARQLIQTLDKNQIRAYLNSMPKE